MFNEWYSNPEAFQTDYEEYQALMEELARPEETEVEVSDDCEWGDLFDIVREYEENLTDDEREALNEKREDEWMELYKRGEYPYEM